MNFLILAVVFPLLGALGLSFIGRQPVRHKLNITLSAVSFGITLIVWGVGKVDPLAALFGALSGFIGLSAALIDRNAVAREKDQTLVQSRRYDHVLCQLLLSLCLMGLYTNNTGLLWLALAFETMIMALGISLPRTRPALHAAWSYLIFNGIGVGLALFGTLLLSLAAETATVTKFPMMSFTVLSSGAVHFNQAWLSLGFVLVVFGYCTKAVLMPLCDWTAESYAEGPVGLTCISRGLSTNVILLAILRFRHIVQTHTSIVLPEDFLLLLAISGIFLSAFSVLRQKDIRRFLGNIASGQAAITLFAFGIGGPVAVFAGLLQMLLWPLLKSAMFLAFVRAAHEKQSKISFRGLPKTNKYALFVFGLGLLAVMGLPPSGLYVSEFMIIAQAILCNPWIFLPFLFCFSVFCFLIMRHAGSVLFVSGLVKNLKINDWGVNAALLYLILFFVFAYIMPSPLYHTLMQAAEVGQ